LSIGAAACLVGSIVLSIVHEEAPASRVGSDSTNPSAFGHAAFVDLLRASGVEVSVSRHATTARTPRASLLVVLEPDLASTRHGREDLERMVSSAACPVLLALPKWRPIEDADGSYRARRRSPSEVDAVLGVVDSDAHVRHVAPSEELFTDNLIAASPTLSEGQVVESRAWRPITSSRAGFLAAERRRDGRSITVLADPDVLANHGLHRGANAAYALDLVRRLRTGDGPVLLDETLHGLGVPVSFWAQLFDFPLVLATAQAALALALFLGGGMRRFGAPERPPPPFGAGKGFLIDHSARLLERERHHGEAVARYAALVAEEVARRVHAEPAARHAGLAGWVAAAEKRARLTESFFALESEAAGLRRIRAADPRRALALAQRLHHWKQEMLDGPQVRAGARS
jgi:hypothetical protein